MIRTILAVSSILLLTGTTLWAADPVPVAQPPSAVQPAATATVSPELEAGRQRLAIARQLQEISTKYLGSLDEAMRKEGRAKALEIRDPLAVDSIIRILGPGNEDMRTLECEMLGPIPGTQASAALAKIILTDASEPVRLIAIRSLKMHADKGGIQPLINALRGSGDPYLRAAYALGDVGDLQVASDLVSRLRRLEPRTVQEYVMKQPSGFFSGTITPYVAGGHVVAAPGGGAVAYAPDVGYTSNGVGMGGNPSSGGPVLEKRDVLILTEQPAILEAMKKITGQDFGYDVVKWRTWLGKALAAQKSGQPLPPATATPIPAPAK